VVQGDFGFSFSQYPRTVSDVLAASLWWTLMLQLPAILVGWTIGNMLGALAAYLKGASTKCSCPVRPLPQQFPAFGMASSCWSSLR
jgi:peptide/nickel transport system permease protein